MLMNIRSANSSPDIYFKQHGLTIPVIQTKHLINMNMAFKNIPSISSLYIIGGVEMVT